MSSNTTFPASNGAIHNTAQVIKAMMSSAAEVELGALYIDAKFAAPVWQMLKEMEHSQPPMTTQTDNLTAFGIITNKIILKAPKAMDFLYHWLCDREQQQQFRCYWQPGKTNYTDYWTKHHMATHHKAIRPLFINTHQSVTNISNKGGTWGAIMMQPLSTK